MAQPREQLNGKYIYAVIADNRERSMGDIGIAGSPVYTITNGSVAFVVSDVSDKKMRPERRHIAAHQEVLKCLLEDTTPLPMGFGIIADDTDAVKRILALNQDSFLGQLNSLKDTVEFGLRVSWDVPNIFDYFIRTHADLRMLRDDLFTNTNDPSLDDKIELGRVFERTMMRDREELTAQVEEALQRWCHRIKRNKCRNEREVMHLACLVAKKKQSDFEAGVFDSAQLFDNNYTFDYNGPWAPHNFVEISLDL